MTRLRFLISALLLLLFVGPAAADSKLTVGAIYVGSTNDYGYNRSMHDGLMAMKEAVTRRTNRILPSLRNPLIFGRNSHLPDFVGES